MKAPLLQRFRAWLIAPLANQITELQTTMSAYTESLEKIRAGQEQSKDLLASLRGDIESLHAKLEQLNNSPDPVTVDDQRLIDQILMNSENALNTLKSLDDITPGNPPQTPDFEPIQPPAPVVDPEALSKVPNDPRDPREEDDAGGALVDPVTGKVN